MNKFMIAAPSSSSGKTVVSCGIIAALKKRGKKVAAFKCGPDYIDPMFHRSVLGVESHNLDLFLSDEEKVKSVFEEHIFGRDVAVIEGVMGFFDGLGGVSDRASAYHISSVTDCPVILVIKPKGASLTLGAQIKGILSFRKTKIIGIILNDCSKMLYESLGNMLEEETGIPVFGFIPHMEEADFESRHLGLMTAEEIDGISEKIEKIASEVEKNVDIDAILEKTHFEDGGFCKIVPCEKRVTLGVARDRAFCFLYEQNLEVLRNLGCEIVFFSPLKDRNLPKNIDGIYIPGGYPELYARELSENTQMRNEIKKAVLGGVATVAECGGLLYLCQSLEDSFKNTYEMAGVLESRGIKKEGLVRFGYSNMTSLSDSLLFEKGDTIAVHEFHYWDTDKKGEAFLSQKPIGKKQWKSGFATDTLYAAFAHIYFAGCEKAAKRFVSAMEEGRKNGKA